MTTYSKETQYRQRPRLIIANGFRIIHPTHEQLIEAGWAVDQFAPLAEWQRHSASPLYADGVAFWGAEDWPLEQIADAKRVMVRDSSAATIDAITGVTRAGEYSRFPTAAAAITDREIHGAARPEDPATATALRALNAAVEPVIGKEHALLAAISDALAAGDGDALRAITWQ